MNAELIAVGSEMLQSGRRDSNSEWLTDRLVRRGFRVAARTIVGDDRSRIAAAAAAALSRSRVVVVCGGLGPTRDDVTREGLADALGVPLERDPEMETRLEAWFRERGRGFSPAQAREAERPRGARWIINTVGTAPGFIAETGDARLVALPGVPAEMKAMFDEEVEPLLPSDAGAGKLGTVILKVAGRTESYVDERTRDLPDLPGVTLTLLANPEAIEIVIQVEADAVERREARLGEIEEEIGRRLGRDLFGREGDTLPKVVGDLLLSQGKTLATAESCTAGLLAGAITQVPGSSAWFRGGLVVYANDLKTALCGVDPLTLDRHGAVSAAVARELAEGARERCGADLGVGITGIAGPSGGSPGKPVGLVHVGLADEKGSVGRELRLGGERELIRRRTVAVALDQVRRRLRGWI